MVFRVSLNKALDLVLILVNAESTGGINDGTTFFKAFMGCFEDRFLQRNTDLGAVVHVALNCTRISSEHSLSGARCIDKDLIEEQRKARSNVFWRFIKDDGALDA